MRAAVCEPVPPCQLRTYLRVAVGLGSGVLGMVVFLRVAVLWVVRGLAVVPASGAGCWGWRLSASSRVVRVPVSGRCVCICGFLFHRLYGDLRLYLHLVQVVEVERISAGFCACRVPVSGGCACICGFL